MGSKVSLCAVPYGVQITSQEPLAPVSGVHFHDPHKHQGTLKNRSLASGAEPRPSRALAKSFAAEGVGLPGPCVEREAFGRF